MFRLNKIWSTQHTRTGFLVVLVGFLIVPNLAEAGCSDYVLIGGRRQVHTESAHRFTLDYNANSLENRFGIRRQEDDRRSNSNPRQPPCQGPNCSERSIPPSAPLPKISQSVTQWAVLIDPLVINDQSSLPRLADSFEFVSKTHGLSIFRPPR